MLFFQYCQVISLIEDPVSAEVDAPRAVGFAATREGNSEATLIPDRNQNCESEKRETACVLTFLIHQTARLRSPAETRSYRLCNTYNRLCDYRIGRPSYNCNGCKRSHARRTGVRSRSIRKLKCHLCIESRLRSPQGERTHGSHKDQGTVELRVGWQLRLREVKEKLICL